MRIITGKAKGKRLAAPEGRDTRPTTERVKEGLFSAINFEIPDKNILDLFAGSGQLGLEALSRGAKFATFVEHDKAAAEIIKNNIDNCGFNDCSKLINKDYSVFLMGNREKFDIIFLDPPYKAEILHNLLDTITSTASDDALIVCEHPVSDAYPDTINGFNFSRHYKYGKIAVTVYRRKDDRV